MKKNSFFVVIEGLDGSGKSEISKRLSWQCKTLFPDKVLLTFEPHDASCAGLYIRQVLMKRINEQSFSYLGLALAFAANRLDHYHREIKPFLKAEKRIVICDRYYLSSLVYQSRDGLTIKDVMELNRGAITPDLTIFLNVSNNICYERMQKRDQEKDLFEKNLDASREKYRLAINFLRKTRSENIVEINADGSINDVLNNAIEAINQFAPNWMSIPQALPFSEEHENGVFSIKEKNTRIIDVINNIRQTWSSISIETLESLHLAMNGLKLEVQKYCNNLNQDEITSLFFEYLEWKNYRLGKILPWSEVIAQNIEFELPLGIQQNGLVFILNKFQREDIFLRRIARESFSYLNFVILFSPSLSQSQNHFESDVINTGTSPVTPKILRIDNSFLEQFAMSIVFQSFYEDFYYTINGSQEFKTIFLDYCKENQFDQNLSHQIIESTLQELDVDSE